MSKNQFVRICLEIFAGIIISVILSAILIAFGYYKVKSNDFDSYSIKLIGFTLYNITKSGSEYVGEAINQNMSIIGIITSIIVIIVNETRVYLKNRK